MSKIAIITLTKNPNYGNVLQNIAMQIVLRDLGHDTETIKNMYQTSLFSRKKGIKNFIKIFINFHGEASFEKRRRRFVKCCEKNINYSKTYYDGERIVGSIESYDYFLAGSDQIWNPNFGLATQFELLDFAPKEKRISYSASFGISSLTTVDSYRIQQISEGISNFTNISVREEDGQKLVKLLTDRDAYVHIDPTLLLSRDDWDRLLYKPMVQLPSQYILVYLLGDIPQKYLERIEDEARLRKSEMINVLDDNFKILDPIEFIWLIKNSSCIFTDSFHATVFSIIYHKDFYVLNRQDTFENQNSRFDTLFKKLGINAKIYGINDILEQPNENWEMIEEQLALERDASMLYLKKL